ncbi:MAG TPA: head GIN domain-containing protein [Ferruginibacter sp.]|nr:head GIN domain-containing protein [Ferruginibacter sp.]HPH93056.1 head GIN domain-containing protein [Ferruginibacter sp.]
MKKIFLSLITLLSLQLYAQDLVVNDANAEKRTLSSGFSAIQVSDGIEVFLTQGGEESVAVSASDQKYMERFKTEVKDGTLKIYYDSKSMVWNSNEKRKLRAYVSFKNIDNLKASSGSDIRAKSVLKLESLKMHFSSGAQFNGEVNITQLDVSENSGAEVNVTGTAENLKTDLNSGAMFKGFDLAVNFCDAKASSGAEVRITVNKELAAKANSGGSIKYKGEGVVKDINVNSGGSVKKS